MRLHVVLIEPQFPGNLGFVARSMMNWGETRLHLVRPCEITEETRDRAVHAQTVLNQAEVYESFEDVRRKMDYTAAFTARVSASDRSHLRIPLSLPEVAPRLAEMEGDVALVFGREDFGLSNEDVEKCDLAVYIPTSDMYRSMNLSHAVSVALYEFKRTTFPSPTTKLASTHEKEILFRTVEHLTDVLGYQPHRKTIINLMWRKFVGKSVMTRWEYHRIMGLFTGPMKRLGKWPPPDLPAVDPSEADLPEEPVPDWDMRTNPRRSGADSSSREGPGT